MTEVHTDIYGHVTTNVGGLETPVAPAADATAGTVKPAAGIPPEVVVEPKGRLDLSPEEAARLREQVAEVQPEDTGPSDLDILVSQVVPPSEHDDVRDFLAEATQHAESSGLRPDVAEHLLRFIVEEHYSQDANRAVDLSSPDAYDAAQRTMRQQWGSEYVSNVQRVQTVVQRLGIHDYLKSTGLGNDPGVLSGLLALADGTMALTPEQAKGEIATLMVAGSPYMRGDKAAVARVRLLSRLAESTGTSTVYERAKVTRSERERAEAARSAGPGVEEQIADLMQQMIEISDQGGVGARKRVAELNQQILTLRRL